MSFIKQVGATIIGIIVASIILAILSIIALAAMVAGEGMSANIEKNAILRINLQGEVVERAGEENPLMALAGKDFEGIALDEALQAIKKAAENENVQGIYLEGGALAATPAMVEELRQALVEFKKSGKWILAYGEHYSRSAYYLCSTADTVMINPQGILDWTGMASNLMFYKETLEKVGVKMQVFKVGTFKSAVEPFTNTEMSEANRLQVTSFLTSIWNNWEADVAKSRKMKAEKLDALCNELTPLTSAYELKKAGLVDKICYIDQVRDVLRRNAKLKDDDDDINFVGIHQVATAETLGEKHDDKIAVYYAYGDIVDAASSGFSEEHQIVGSVVCEDLMKLRKDDDIKAVVLRVNSGGGSAYASEQIWREVQLLRQEKPVVVSMGGMAASGGYYISCGANKIFADKTTLTGSIGIFGMIPDASELLTEKLGLHFDCVKTNEMADFGATGRPFNEKESAMMQSYVEKGYDLFTNRVAMGRKMTQDSVKVIAEGRVWTGEQALKLGLVDKIGNIDDAIKEAAKLAKVEEYGISNYPTPGKWFEGLMDKHKSGYLESELKEMLGSNYEAIRMLRSVMGQNPLQARIPYAIDIR